MPWATLLVRSLRWASTADDSGDVPLDSPHVAAAIADAYVEWEASRNTPGVMGKIASADGYIRSSQQLLAVAGPVALIEDGAHRVEDGVFANAYLRAPTRAIAGGTVEVFKNILATSVLGLPRPLPTGAHSAQKASK